MVPLFAWSGIQTFSLGWPSHTLSQSDSQPPSMSLPKAKENSFFLAFMLKTLTLIKEQLNPVIFLSFPTLFSGMVVCVFVCVGNRCVVGERTDSSGGPSSSVLQSRRGTRNVCPDGS